LLNTASFYAPEHWKGRCYRVSRAHPRGQRVQWETLPLVYPPRELLRAYRDREVDFGAFSRRYRMALDENYGRLAQFREWASGLPLMDDFTLLCFEREGLPCHRRELARWLLDRVPGLEAGELR
jgi:uncharacterized protein YeaO (DUF488 family)